MDITRLAGTDWGRGRLFFDDASAAEEDDFIETNAPNDEGIFSGRFRDGDDIDVLLDDEVTGRVISNGLNPLIEFVRRNADGTVTTRYVGRVIELAGTTTVMIRGRFTRATTSSEGAVTISSGDHEIEKPT